MKKRLPALPLNDKRPTTVGFRLDDALMGRLQGRAKKLGVSVHELARHYAELSLADGEERMELKDAILALNENLAELRKDVAVSTEALLEKGGKMSSESARRWVSQNILPTSDA